VIIAAVLEKRQQQWAQLERLCDAMELAGRLEQGNAELVSRFASLYRAACADLALADSYQLPPATVTYLHRLVARAHNNLYRADRIDPATWFETIFQTAPRQIFIDPCVRVATLLFFGLFTLAMVLAYQETAFPRFAESILGERQIEQLEVMYEKPLSKSLDHYVAAAGFYIKHNTGIGLQVFALGILIVPCLFILASNAVGIGASFGYMARPSSTGGENFLHFVTAHGPFELTAIALAGAAGLKLGVGLFSTGGLTRSDSLYRAARAAVPIMAASAALFLLAALTEGFISPSPLPYLVKAIWAILSSGLISFYFVVLGFPHDFVAHRDDDDPPPRYDPLGEPDDSPEVAGAA
jgi:uncharacterized membrane protein SpoIIM required for sporulation